jgi:uncharacterized protein YggE
MSLAPTAPSVTVTGRASLAVSPDIARIRMGCQAVLPTVADAVAASSGAVAAVRAALEARGIPVADAPSGRVSLTAQEQWENNRARITGYSAEHQVTITVRELDTVGVVLAEVIAAAGDFARLYGVDFLRDDDAAVQSQARADAFAQAKAMASEYASAAGRELGAVLGIAEDSGHGPSPTPRAKAFAAVAADAVPVEPGAVDATAAVTVTWELV